jgi:hypothetical protein
MKPMSDRKMGMRGGTAESFFPTEPEHKVLSRVGDIKKHKYPDTEMDIHRDQESFVKETSKNLPKPEFRH